MTEIDLSGRTEFLGCQVQRHLRLWLGYSTAVGESLIDVAGAWYHVRLCTAWSVRNSAAAPVAWMELVIGREVGNYRIVSRVAEGGMGVVYLAAHTTLARNVVVKVLREELARDPQIRARFLREAHAACAIRHPNIVEVLDAGTLKPQETPYIVMEFLEGETLTERIKRQGRIPIPVAVDFAQQVTVALVVAHAAGIIHRDLKPDNLFIVPDKITRGHDQIKILDFGIAKLRGGLVKGTLHTQTGTIMGTPVYMSPEQCSGTKQVDHRSDIYSLGVILYEMLCGRPPFFSEGFGELAIMHITAPPRSPREHNPKISKVLEEIILRALAKNPRDRQQTSEELRTALGLESTSPGSSAAKGIALLPTERAHVVRQPPPPTTKVASPSTADAPSTIRIGEGSSGLPNWIYPLISMMGVLVLGLGIMAFFLLKRPVAPTVVVKEVPVAALASGAAPSVVPAIKAESLPTREATAATPRARDERGGKPAKSSMEDLKMSHAGAPAVSPGPSGGMNGGKGSRKDHAATGVAGGGERGGTKVGGGGGDECTITVGSRPWAEIWIDGKSTGKATPLAGYKVSCGKHEVTFKRPDMKREQTETLNVEPGVPFRKVFSLEFDEFDSLIDRAMGSSGGDRSGLDRYAIVVGMNSVKPRVKDCYDQFKVPGTAMVNIIIDKSGGVTSASVSGAFAGTPTGSCVEEAVKTARFPASDGLTTMYPFQLR